MLRSVIQATRVRGALLGASASHCPRRSYATGLQGSSEGALSTQTIGDIVDTQAEKLEYRDAARSSKQDYRFTYLELKEQIDAVAVGLLQARIISGQMFVHSLANELENFVDFFAAAKGRTVMVSVKPDASIDELREALTLTNARGWVTAHKFDGTDRLKVGHELIPELAECLRGDPLRSFEFRNLSTAVHTGNKANENGYTMYIDMPVYDPWPSPLPEMAKSVNMSDPVLGSVYQSKLNLFSQSNLVNNAKFLGEKLGLVRDERLYIATEPESSINQVVSLASVEGGAFFASLPLQNTKQKNVLELLRDIESENATVLVASARIARAIVDHPHVGTLKHHKLNRVAVVNDGSEANAEELASSLATAFGIAQSHVIVSSPTVCGAVAVDGKPLPHSAIQVCDASGNEAADKTEGFLHVKGHQTHGEGWVNTGVRAKVNGGRVVV
eukprot:TRINITY_DN2321_c0_g1_i1.p1 TRINITY_DN2321_c0_g1~~TRINITY_DN2321_c0_g1_i1.p1  ORF type:complete len:444 (-),score=97.88 TRINITY_DN2321_c0_g1_i1:142-1473(-)